MAVDSERHARTVAALDDYGFDALVCASATEVLLLTGYWPVMGASVAIFTADGEVRVIVPEDEAELVRNTSSAQCITYKPAGLHTLERPLSLLRQPLTAMLKQLGLGKARVGLQLMEGVQPSSYAASMEFRSSLKDLLEEVQPHASYVACDDLLESMKSTKTTQELDLLSKAAMVAKAGFAAAASAIRPGLRESEIAAAIQARFEASPDAKPFERSYGYFFCMSGPNSATAAAAYARTRQRVVQEGDLVMIHANTCSDGYWTDVTRTYTAGEPSARQRTMRAAITEARAAALSAIQLGTTGAAVDCAARSVMEAHGYGEAFKHATGHGVGFAAANANALPRIHPLSPDVLEEGMTFNIEPAAYFEGYGGMRHCDLVAVASHGAHVLTDF